MCGLAQIHVTKGFGTALRDAIAAGEDLHCKLGAAFVGLPTITKESHPHERQFAKIGNYGFAVGMGAKTLHRGIPERVLKGELPERFLDYTIEDTQRLREVWFDTWDGMDAFFSYVKDELLHNNKRITQLKSGRVRGGCSFVQAANTLFQGLVADGANLAVFSVSRCCYDPTLQSELFGCRPVMFVHDELILEVPESRVDIALEALPAVMIGAMERYIPDVPIKAEAKAMKRWSK